MAKKRKDEPEADERGFQDRVLAMLEWLADKDPVRAAKLIGEYLDDLAAEVAGKPQKNPA